MKKKLICFVLLLALLLGVVGFAACQDRHTEPEQLPIYGSSNSDSGNTEVPDVSGDYCAVWISYLEWEQLDFSSAEAFTAGISEMFLNCANLGANTVIVQVRPFGDAIYNSTIFPASHLLTGTQGVGVEYDPLSIMITAAHSLGMRLEAWVNPYRVRLNESRPAGELSADNPAVQYAADDATADWVVPVSDGLYYNPGIPEVRALIEAGVRELVENYEVDGIQFDDYFYPTTETDFDTAAYEKYGEGLSLEEWRRENVNTLVREVYALIKETDPTVVFGISPSGNIGNNYAKQYSDVTEWLSTPGYVDYLMPQIYWGFDYTLSNGADTYAFVNCVADWAALPRAASVQLYVGLGAYRIGAGDGCDATAQEWNSGNNLARMVLAAGSECNGFGLYRYDFLYRNTEYPALATSEIAALQLLFHQNGNQENAATDNSASGIEGNAD